MTSMINQVWTDFKYYSGVSTVDFEQVNAGWDHIDSYKIYIYENFTSLCRGVFRTLSKTYGGVFLQK